MEDVPDVDDCFCASCHQRSKSICSSIRVTSNDIDEGLPPTLADDDLEGPPSALVPLKEHPQSPLAVSWKDCFKQAGHLWMAPLVEDASKALNNLAKLLRGQSQGKGGGYHNPGYDPFVHHRLDGMLAVLNLFTQTSSLSYGKWTQSGVQAAIAMGRGVHCAQTLLAMCRHYILDREVLPVNPYGEWNETMLTDESLRLDLELYLQELGKNITAEK